MEFVAGCAAGMEPWLKDELREIAGVRPRPLTGQVSWTGPMRGALAACLWSRLASRVVAILARGHAHTSDTLYELVRGIAWEDHIAPGTTLAVDARGTSADLRSTRFVAQRAKDAVTDALLARRGFRPVIDLAHPDLRIVVRVTRGGASVGIDLAGGSLTRREGGARRGTGAMAASPRADLAALLLRAVGWHGRAHGDAPTLLAVAGSTNALLVEAAGMALDRAPGLVRGLWGHARWLGGDPALWEALYDEARARADAGAARDLRLMACDLRPRSHITPTQALRAAGMDVRVTSLSPAELADAIVDADVATCDISWLGPNEDGETAHALTTLAWAVQRLRGDARGRSQAATDTRDGGHANERGSGNDARHSPTTLAVLTRTDLVDHILGAAPCSITTTLLGRDEATVRTYAPSTLPEPARVTVGDAAVPVAIAASRQFAARLAKVARARARWARHEDVSCYRVYDADLPDYNLAIDLFEGSKTPGRWLQVSEYAPPREIDATRARLRLLDALSIATATLHVRPGDVRVRMRRRARGGSQYASEADGSLTTKGARETRGRADRAHDDRGRQGQAGHADSPAPPPGAHLVDEGGLTFEVNFAARHDCGLFLDHRDTRSWLRELAKSYGPDARFLNLFCYTGSATVYVADGGCTNTTSVDMSAPSLEWARRNLAHNGFGERGHRLVRADVTRWVGDERHSPRRYDLVFCDVPTFSNSKAMGRRSFDVQRDHAELLIGVSRLLVRPHEGHAGGLCVFSCNLRGFRPDVDALARSGVEIEDVTPRTIPKDFSRTPTVHHCYLVRRVAR